MGNQKHVMHKNVAKSYHQTPCFGQAVNSIIMNKQKMKKEDIGVKQ